jgi:cGMP-dependent protein kinase
LTPTPQIRSSSDASNFDKYPNEDDLPPDEISGWDMEF